MYTAESLTVTELIVSEEELELNVTLELQLSDMMLFPGTMKTIIALLNSHAPWDTLLVLNSVTVLPTGTGFTLV